MNSVDTTKCGLTTTTTTDRELVEVGPSGFKSSPNGTQRCSRLSGWSRVILSACGTSHELLIVHHVSLSSFSLSSWIWQSDTCTVSHWSFLDKRAVERGRSLKHEIWLCQIDLVREGIRSRFDANCYLADCAHDCRAAVFLFVAQENLSVRDGQRQADPVFRILRVDAKYFISLAMYHENWVHVVRVWNAQTVVNDIVARLCERCRSQIDNASSCER